MMFLQNCCIGIVVLCIMLVLIIMGLDAWDKEMTIREQQAAELQKGWAK